MSSEVKTHYTPRTSQEIVSLYPQKNQLAKRETILKGLCIGSLLLATGLAISVLILHGGGSPLAFKATLYSGIGLGASSIIFAGFTERTTHQKKQAEEEFSKTNFYFSLRTKFLTNRINNSNINSILNEQRKSILNTMNTNQIRQVISKELNRIEETKEIAFKILKSNNQSFEVSLQNLKDCYNESEPENEPELKNYFFLDTDLTLDYIDETLAYLNDLEVIKDKETGEEKLSYKNPHTTNLDVCEIIAELAPEQILANRDLFTSDQLSQLTNVEQFQLMLLLKNNNINRISRIWKNFISLFRKKEIHLSHEKFLNKFGNDESTNNY